MAYLQMTEAEYVLLKANLLLHEGSPLSQIPHKRIAGFSFNSLSREARTIIQMEHKKHREALHNIMMAKNMTFEDSLNQVILMENMSSTAEGLKHMQFSVQTASRQSPTTWTRRSSSCSSSTSAASTANLFVNCTSASTCSPSANDSVTHLSHFLPVTLFFLDNKPVYFERHKYIMAGWLSLSKRTRRQFDFLRGRLRLLDLVFSTSSS